MSNKKSIFSQELTWKHRSLQSWAPTYLNLGKMSAFPIKDKFSALTLKTCAFCILYFAWDLLLAKSENITSLTIVRSKHSALLKLILCFKRSLISRNILLLHGPQCMPIQSESYHSILLHLFAIRFKKQIYALFSFLFFHELLPWSTTKQWCW